ncbi:MAG TPA: spore coat protein [Micromonosporaceae bacterium]
MSAPQTTFVCDAGIVRGVGHLMRSLALAEEFAARGDRPVIVADVEGMPWATAQVVDRGFRLLRRAEGAPGLADEVLALRPDAVVIDSYVIDPAVSAAIRRAGTPVLAIVDGSDRGQSADLYVDQNLGAEDVWIGADCLAGLRYVLLRDAVRAARPAQPRSDGDVAVPRVLAYFGGTDPVGAAPVCARALASTREPFDATFVAATPEHAATIDAVPRLDGQRITVTGPIDDLPARAAAADLVLCAAGTSVWEMMAVGAATAVTWVADNQAVGYAGAVASGAVAGLGHIADLRRAPQAATAVIATLLRDPAARAGLRSTGWSLVDGHGRGRVADALGALVGRPR